MVEAFRALAHQEVCRGIRFLGKDQQAEPEPRVVLPLDHSATSPRHNLCLLQSRGEWQLPSLMALLHSALNKSCFRYQLCTSLATQVLILYFREMETGDNTSRPICLLPRPSTCAICMQTKHHTTEPQFKYLTFKCQAWKARSKEEVSIYMNLKESNISRVKQLHLSTEATEEDLAKASPNFFVYH